MHFLKNLVKTTSTGINKGKCCSIKHMGSNDKKLSIIIPQQNDDIVQPSTPIKVRKKITVEL
jgi:hypothetical protein